MPVQACADLPPTHLARLRAVHSTLGDLVQELSAAEGRAFHETTGCVLRDEGIDASMRAWGLARARAFAESAQSTVWTAISTIMASERAS